VIGSWTNLVDGLVGGAKIFVGDGEVVALAVAHNPITRGHDLRSRRRVYDDLRGFAEIGLVWNAEERVDRLAVLAPVLNGINIGWTCAESHRAGELPKSGS
jgi:hypothetical protein